jgi:hypothetical protein
VDPPPERAAERSLQELGTLLLGSERWAIGLVRAEEVPIPELRSAFSAWERALVAQHPRIWEPLFDSRPAVRVEGAAAPELLRREHRIFPGSLEQLRWFGRLVERNDHGGNRQALGQYLRIFLEAVGRHVGDEAKYLASWTASTRGMATAGSGR